MKKTSLLAIPTALVLGLGTYAAKAETAIVAGGCFWCVESDFESIKGVTSVVPGYIGGAANTATYKKVSKGNTGHYEAVKITFNPAIISYEKVVDLFWRSIDPTDAGGQFCDRGNSYKSAIFPLNATQHKVATQSKKDLQSSGRLPGPIATKIAKAGAFYPAEEYHQDYYKKEDIILTRFGPLSKKKAYKKYRKACGRDARVRQIWGSDAFVHGGS